ncbi:unnamed protein product [Peronospora effusa]|uniref:Uncharacterized protein n=1 Tax=Peronospora effusa TaxID=542832 RepID=A0A3M6VKE9_9STRA|nr:hypothetical protein DD238_005235 [Peronospora effusa]CAI5701326.1 unnamed protein product [Peronospora effusa]
MSVCACNARRRGHGACKEHVESFAHTLFAALAAEDPVAAPRAVGALQTHWSSFIRPEATLFMSLLVKVDGKKSTKTSKWRKIFVKETKNRFEAIWQKEEADAMRAISEAKQLAVLEDADLPPLPRTIPTKFRYVHCISVLKTSKRSMRAVMSARRP